MRIHQAINTRVWEDDTKWIVDQKYLENFEMWCWRMENISWIDHVRNGVLQRVKEERNILRTIKRRKANWIGHILRRHCLLKHVIEGKTEGKIEMTGRRKGRRRQLLDDFRQREGNWELIEEALELSLEEAMDLS
jgi:hypothetical protein